MKKLLLLLASVALFAVGCQNNLTDETIGGSINDSTTITVSLNDTRISLGEKDGDSYPVYWSEGDKITVNGVLSEEAQINAENKASATFQFSKVLSHPLHITYPYCASTTAETPIVEFPAEQTYAEGTFASGYAPMCGYAESKSNAISLSHLAGVLRFPVIAAHEGVVLEKVVITSQNKIAGEFTVDCQNATISATEGCGNTVTYTLPANYTLSTTTPSEFFITLPAVELGACTIEFVETSGGKMVANWSINKPLPQGIVREFKTIIYQHKSTISLPSFASEEDEFIIEKPKQPNNEIWYTATAKVTPFQTDVFGANIISNTYEKGMGIIKFDRDVISIGLRAFQGCSNLVTITIPNSVTSIGTEAFYNCKGLESIAIPNCVTSIEQQAFMSCPNLASVIIPNSVTKIGARAFNSFSKLMDVHIMNIDMVTSFAGIFSDYNLWHNGNLVTEYDFPEGITEVDERLAYCKSIQTVTIPHSAVNIKLYAFRNCSSLTSVTIPDSVTSIGSSTFSGCSSLVCITIPNSVTSIGDGAFSKCENLESITIPEGISKIGDYTFSYCKKLTSIIIPDGVTSIGERAFQVCNALTSITIPEGVTLIEDYAFMECINLEKVYCKAITPPEIGTNTFYFCNPLFYVPTLSLDTYKQNAKWYSYQNRIFGYDYSE